MAELSFKKLTKTFGSQTVLHGVDFTIRSGEFFSVLGPSGCGKTTLLRLIAGFEVPSSGEIHLRGSNILLLPPAARNVGMVFQNYALFPHMTVYQNVSFGLEGKDLSKEEIRMRVSRVLESVGLTDKLDTPVPLLSGGEQQRVAVARAVVVEPAVLLFDEPLSNLDVALRASTREEIRQIHRRTGITAVYVTHDQSEALSISDRIAVMEKGVIQQVGTPAELYENPATPFVAQFLGGATILRGSWDGSVLNVGDVTFMVPPDVHGRKRGTCSVAIKPEYIRPAATAEPGSFTAILRGVEYQGFTTSVVLRYGNVTLRSSCLSSEFPRSLREGDTMSVSITWARCTFFQERQ